MNVIDDLTRANLQQETVATIGAFDGVHRGHQSLIHRVVDRAHTTDRLAALITFHPLPAQALAPDRAPPYLTTPGEKVALLEALGLDLVVLLPFDDQMAATPARLFMEAVSQHLHLRELWVGTDFALGRDRTGDVGFLQELGSELGYDVHVVPSVTSVSGAISSSRIRALLREGKVGEATQLLGRYPSVAGEVVAGTQRGRMLGFPTANLEVRPERAVPADGVYAAFALLGTKRFLAVANIGMRPSFGHGQHTIETHILDFEGDIHGCDLVVEFVARLRDERRFVDTADLVDQIQQDSHRARLILSDGAEAAEVPEGAQVPCPFRHREIEHTADRALQVWADDLPALFVGAARGMYSLMADLDGLVATDWRQVQLESWDRESLLVDWLNELLFVTETDGLLFVDYRIESLTGTALTAQVGGAAGPVTKASIKAATFHNLALARDEQGWSTLITFDI